MTSNWSLKLYISIIKMDGKCCASFDVIIDVLLSKIYYLFILSQNVACLNIIIFIYFLNMYVHMYIYTKWGWNAKCTTHINCTFRFIKTNLFEILSKEWLNYWVYTPSHFLYMYIICNYLKLCMYIKHFI